MRGRIGRPGLIGVAARTAVVAGTAQAVSGGVQRRQAARAQQAAEAQAQQQYAAIQGAPFEPPPPAPVPEPATAMPSARSGGTDDMLSALERLAALRQQGILTDEEFAAQKAKILG